MRLIGSKIREAGRGLTHVSGKATGQAGGRTWTSGLAACPRAHVLPAHAGHGSGSGGPAPPLPGLPPPRRSPRFRPSPRRRKCVSGSGAGRAPRDGRGGLVDRAAPRPEGRCAGSPGLVPEKRGLGDLKPVGGSGRKKFEAGDREPRREGGSDSMTASAYFRRPPSAGRSSGA